MGGGSVAVGFGYIGWVTMGGSSGQIGLQLVSCKREGKGWEVTMGHNEDMNQFKCYYEETTTIERSEFQIPQGTDHVNAIDQVTVPHSKIL